MCRVLFGVGNNRRPQTGFKPPVRAMQFEEPPMSLLQSHNAWKRIDCQNASHGRNFVENRLFVMSGMRRVNLEAEFLRRTPAISLVKDIENVPLLTHYLVTSDDATLSMCVGSSKSQHSCAR